MKKDGGDLIVNLQEDVVELREAAEAKVDLGPR